MRAVERQRQQAQQRVATHIVAIVPELTVAQALALMAEAKVRHIALHATDRHLAAHPDALTNGDPQCPLAVQRLIGVLHTAGLATVAPIGCASCGATDTPLAWASSNGRICRRCARQHAPKQPCARCGRITGMEGRRPQGRICGSCAAADPNTFDDCGGCGRRARPYRRLADGTALCQRCAPVPAHQCSSCGRTAPAAAHTTSGPICGRCYPAHVQPRRACSACHRIRPVKVRATGGHGDLCASCAPDRTDTCTRCGRDRPGRRRDGGFVCHSCRTNHTGRRAVRPTRRCALCQQQHVITAQWPVGPVCAACYRKTQQQPGPCVGCARLRVLTGRRHPASAAPDLCGPCAGGHDYACSNCDTPGPSYSYGQCARCVLSDRLHATFTDSHGSLQSQYATLVAVLSTSNQPESLLVNWLKPTNPAVQLLTRLARDHTPLTHELLDDLPQTQHLLHLRRLLIFAAVLPPRPHEYLHRLGPWLRDQLADRPAHHRRIVYPYAEWDLLHRARRRARRRGRLNYTTAIYVRTRISAALDLLAWLDQQHTTLDQLTQHQLDKWLDSPGHQHKPIADFLRWAAKTRHARQLTIPARRSDRSRPLLDEDRRWQQLHQCLHDDTLPLPVRVVGTLTLLFGVTTSRILELTTHDITVLDDTVRLTIGTSPIHLPPRVADLIRCQLEHANSINLNAPELVRWLLPGQLGTLPINPAHMCDLLTDAGIDARAGRHTALADLAATLPPPVLASLLGINITTAIAWSHRAQQDWSAYLAARHAEQHGTTTPNTKTNQ